MAVHLTPALEQDLQHLALESNSTVDELAQTALEQFVAYRLDLNEAVRRADEDIAAGRLLEHHEVVARIERLSKTDEGYLDAGSRRRSCIHRGAHQAGQPDAPRRVAKEIFDPVMCLPAFRIAGASANKTRDERLSSRLGLTLLFMR